MKNELSEEQLEILKMELHELNYKVNGLEIIKKNYILSIANIDEKIKMVIRRIKEIEEKLKKDE